MLPGSVSNPAPADLSSDSPDALSALRAAAAGLALDWARLLAPHFGAGGSMDLDRIDYPDAEGPSFYNQFSHAALLQLATGMIPGASPEERARFLDLALRNLDYCLGMTDAEFHTPHYSRGRDWGRHIGEWLVYHLLASLEILERTGQGAPDLRRRLRRTVEGATQALVEVFAARYAEPPPEFPGNHATWHGLLFFRAGSFFGHEPWREWARGFFARCVLPFQHASGGWPEGQGLVVGYSLITAQAVSIYAELAGDELARSAVDRFLGFFRFFSLPDGSSAVVVDNRMRRHAHPFLFLPPGFLRREDGCRLALRQIDALRVHLAGHGVRDNGAQAFAFFGSFCEFLFGMPMRGAAAATGEPRQLPAVRLEQDGWVAFLGWQLTPEHPSRFVLDSQNFIELWHRDAGYLAGTGNSKFMPRFSTLRRTNAGRSYIPDRAAGRRTGPGEAVAEFGFGPDALEVRLQLVDGGCSVAARVTRAVSGAAYEFSLLLALQPGDEVRWGERAEQVNPARLLQVAGPFTWRGLTWSPPAEATLEYPLVPHYSYTQHGLPPPADYVARLAFRVDGTERAVRVGRGA